MLLPLQIALGQALLFAGAIGLVVTIIWLVAQRRIDWLLFVSVTLLAAIIVLLFLQ